VNPLPASLLPVVAGLIRECLDIIDERVGDEHIPSWSEARGWTQYLLSIPESELPKLEAEGLGAGLQGAPAGLACLAARVGEALQAVPVASASPTLGPVRKASPRKLSQLGALLQAAGPMLQRAERLVDVGSGSGSLVAALASRFDKPVVGIEIAPERVKGAQRRAAGAAARFEQRDGVAAGLGLCETDLALGLHACGALGDAMVVEAARTGACVALVTCCVQKLPGPWREPVSALGAREGLRLKREVLGLANLVPREQGVEVPTHVTMLARQARCALRLLLKGRGFEIQPGQEMRGVNRRAANRGALALSAEALRARGLQPATEQELHQAQQRASELFARVRRLSLPRSMLGPIVELAVVLDRAQALAEAGHQVRVERLFGLQVSPRNLVILAAR
jgi:SAM-dependent methyltransferase